MKSNLKEKSKENWSKENHNRGNKDFQRRGRGKDGDQKRGPPGFTNGIFPAPF